MNSKLIKAFLYNPKPKWILYILVRKKERKKEEINHDVEKG